MYRYGLALQELAGRLAAQPADQLSLLHQAAEVYLEASRLAGDRHAAVLCECPPEPQLLVLLSMHDHISSSQRAQQLG